MMKLYYLVSLATFGTLVHADHTFNFVNRCSYTIDPIIANTNCGYSPRCNTPNSGGAGVPLPAISFHGGQPGQIAKGQSKTVHINRQWNGRIFNQNGHCGAAGEKCTMAEFNLDTGNAFTAQHSFCTIPCLVACTDIYLYSSVRSWQAYDISNIQGFTQSMSIAVGGCDTVTCTNVNCGCHNAYKPGDLSGCGNDSPVRGCSPGDKSWTITFCP
ncbi:hypothetical protein D9613_007839 [Agrocybe pediades]|uniref:Thaumatin-like protein n=1 Tax=Agrocybe pediades TaxID=84607 RepID=A0A8H4QMV6_9AGAR|nr:hypothetical protein D9613_007839 [Agrocybe pediades]